MSLRTLGTLALLAALATANANADADADAPFIVGVATHSMNNTAQPLRSLQMASAAGVTSVRDDAFWSTAEPTAGQLQIVAPWRAWRLRAAPDPAAGHRMGGEEGKGGHAHA